MYLMNRNKIVADIEIKHGRIYNINKIYDESALPVGVYPVNYELGRDEEKDADLLDEWWGNNSIPTDRGSARIGLERIGVTDARELKLLSRGLSLLNDYWLKNSDEKITWEDVNFWDNSFSDEIGKALFNHKAIHSTLREIGASPDTGLNGVLPKKWIHLKDGYYVVKGGSSIAAEEVFNEVLASGLMTSIGLPNAAYQLYKDENEVCCISKCLTTRSTELIPFYQIIDSISRKFSFDGQEELDHIKNVLESYHVKGYETYINSLLCIDYILAGTDRHYNNLSLLHDKETGEYRLSPVYDSGTCLWVNTKTPDIDPLDDSITARPFCNKNTFGTWEKQKQYINQYIPLKKADFICNLLQYVENVIKHSEMSPNRYVTIAECCLKRGHELQKYLSGQNVDIPTDAVITEKDIQEFHDFLQANITRLDSVVGLYDQTTKKDKTNA